MTAKELFEWALNNGIENCNLVVRDIEGNETKDFKPIIIKHTDYTEIELRDE